MILSDEELTYFIGNLSVYGSLWPGSYIISGYTELYSNPRVGLPVGTRFITGAVLLSFAIKPSFAGCWVRGRTGSLSLWTSLPIAEGVLPSPPLQFRDKIADQGMLRRCVSGVWGPLMLNEFQLWVLSTIVMVAVAIVGVKLPG